MSRVTSAEQSKLLTSFETVRRTLLSEKEEQHLQRPLAYWALPNDRRLPLALLDRPLKDLLQLQFEDLSATKGIGQKKMGAMIKLLLRAAEDQSHDVPFGLAELADGKPDDAAGVTIDGLDSASVSESQWTAWVKTVIRHRMQREPVGRFATSLSELPSVLWTRPLGYYTNYSLAEIRALKTHGEKRVAVILNAFHEIDRSLGSAPSEGPIAFCAVPRFAREIESWVASALATGNTKSELPAEDDIRKFVVAPLVRQAKYDLGEDVAKICEGRLGLRGKPQGVKAQSQRMGVTRARVYQLLDEVAKATWFRWPAGRFHLGLLSQRYRHHEADPDTIRLIDVARELFYPEKLAVDRDGEDE